jgi:hypothetical protein
MILLDKNGLKLFSRQYDDVFVQKIQTRIGTWIVKTMHDDEKLKHVVSNIKWTINTEVERNEYTRMQIKQKTPKRTRQQSFLLV